MAYDSEDYKCKGCGKLYANWVVEGWDADTCYICQEPIIRISDGKRVKLIREEMRWYGNEI